MYLGLSEAWKSELVLCSCGGNVIVNRRQLGVINKVNAMSTSGLSYTLICFYRIIIKSKIAIGKNIIVN